MQTEPQKTNGEKRKIMSLYEVYTTKMCHDLAGVIGTLGNTIECMEIDDTFLTEGIGLLKNSGKVLTARLKFFRALLGLNTSITPELAEQYLQTYTPSFIIQGMVCNRLALAFILLGAECLIRGGTITITEDQFCFEGTQIIWDESKQKILTGIEQILKPQYMAVLWINEWLKNHQKVILTEQTATQLIFRIKSI